MDARYSRQIALPGFGASAQEALSASRVLVIGAGGLGSSVIPALAAAGVGSIGIVDDDRVELSNLHRQHIHGVADIGHPKVESAAASVAALNPSVSINPIQRRLTAANAQALFADYDLVLDGSDNFPTRYLANDAGVLAGIPVVWGAVSQYGGQVGVSAAHLTPGTTYRDLFPTPPPPGSVLSCEVGGVLPTTVGVIGSLMATEAIKLITGIGTPLFGRVTIFDGLTGGFRQLDYAADPTAEPITGLIDYQAFCGYPSSLTPAELAARIASQGSDDFILLDVREPWEADIAALEDSVLVPLGQLGDVEFDVTKPIIAYCHHGIRSETARQLLAARGYDVSHLAGGIDAWARDVDPSMARY